MNAKNIMRRITLPTVAVIVVALVTPAIAGPREQAKRMHDRLAGIPPSSSTLDSMAALIAAGNSKSAASIAIDSSAFYSVTLKNMVTPWSNRDQTVFEPLNDYVATVIGMIRDNVPFTEALSADILYVASSSINVPSYSMVNNDHYEALETSGVDLRTGLVRTTQSSVTDLPAEATAGLMTTRAGAKAFFVAGTNRAMLRFTLMNHLCNDLEQLKDVTRSPDRIRQDVTRSPGGDSRIFLNACVGCHSGMDPLAQAFAYYDFDDALGRIVYNGVGFVDPESATRVQGKYLINSDSFPYGFVTTDDRWDNYWRAGQNSTLVWDTALASGGNGAKSLGVELARSEAFARCQVQKVFKTVCLRDPIDTADNARFEQIVTAFKASNYSMKEAFSESAVYCMGD